MTLNKPAVGLKKDLNIPLNPIQVEAGSTSMVPIIWKKGRLLLRKVLVSMPSLPWHCSRRTLKNSLME